MQDAGYDVTIQPYKFTYYAYLEPGVERGLAGSQTFALNETGTRGRAREQPPTLRSSRRRHHHPATSSPARQRCTMNDFSGFVAGGSL